MPQKVWQVGEEVIAPDFNTYVQSQVLAQFPNTAARDTWTAPPNGAMCVTTDTYTVWQRKAGAWVVWPLVTNLGTVVTGAGLSATAPTGGAITRFTNDLALPAGTGRFLVTYAGFVTSTAALNLTFRMYNVGGAGYFDYKVVGPTAASVCFSGIAAAGSSPAVHGINSGAAGATVYADSSNHAIFATGTL